MKHPCPLCGSPPRFAGGVYLIACTNKKCSLSRTNVPANEWVYYSRRHNNHQLLIDHLKNGGCHAAQPGETTFECDPKKPCWACEHRNKPDYSGQIRALAEEHIKVLEDKVNGAVIYEFAESIINLISEDE